MNSNNRLISVLIGVFICPALFILRLFSVSDIQKAVDWNSGWIKYSEIPIIMKIIMLIFLIISVFTAIIKKLSSDRIGNPFIFLMLFDIICGLFIIFLSFELK